MSTKRVLLTGITGFLGSHTYMLTCSSMEERDKGWSAFVADPEWKKLVTDSQYVNTISKISNTFLVPTSYSQV